MIRSIRQEKELWELHLWGMSSLKSFLKKNKTELNSSVNCSINASFFMVVDFMRWEIAQLYLSL